MTKTTELYRLRPKYREPIEAHTECDTLGAAGTLKATWILGAEGTLTPWEQKGP